MRIVYNMPNQLIQPAELIFSKYGWMFCPPGDTFVTGSLREWGVYSETEAILLRRLCVNRNVLIAGGHIGAIAVPVAQVAQSVTVYEPQTLLAKFCAANAAINGLSHKMYVKNAALGAASGTINVPIITTDSKFNMGAFGKDNWGEGVEIKVDPISQLLYSQYVDFILLDVEGMELEILRGAAEAIDSLDSGLKPLMWVECDRNDSGADLIDFIYSMSYKPYWMYNPLTPNNVDPNSGPWPLQASMNLLCVPNGSEWPLPDIPQYLATNTDVFGQCEYEKLLCTIKDDE